MDDLPQITLGIDPASTRLAYVALLADDDFLMAAAKNLGKSGGEACSSAWAYMGAALDTIQARWPGIGISAFIESPIVGKGGVRSTMVQCYTSGAIQGALYDRGIRSQAANVSSWKKHVVGKGNATKPEVGDYLRHGWPAIYREANGNQDLYDAACIALYGKQQST